MSVQIQRAPAPPPFVPLTQEGVGMVTVCSLRAQTLRRLADLTRSPLHAERAAVQYGAAAVLERAAVMWSNGQDGDARGWMAAAENSLAAALVPVPWATEG